MEIDRAAKACFVTLIIAFFIIPMIPATAGALNGVPSFDAGGGSDVRGRVYYDLNYDGTYQEGEPAIACQTILLYDGGGTLLSLTYTGEDGTYAFTEIPAGQYVVHRLTDTLFDGTSPDTLLMNVDSEKTATANFGAVFAMPRPDGLE